MAGNSNRTREAVEQRVTQGSEQDDAAKQADQKASGGDTEAQKSAALEQELQELRDRLEAEQAEREALAKRLVTVEQRPRNRVGDKQTIVRSYDADGNRVTA